MFKHDILRHILSWFQTGVPQPSSKNLHTQLGVHCEEVGEMLEALDTDSAETATLLLNAERSIKALAKHLKTNDQVVYPVSHKLLLDALCDQIVTSVGAGHMLGYGIFGAMCEVDASNWSKFVDGQPVFDENQKIQKGPGYFKPNLTPFIPLT